MSGFDGLMVGEGLPRPQLLGERSAAPAEADGEGGESGGFSAVLDSLRDVRDLGADVQEKANALASGQPVEVHDLMVAMGKSEVAFNLMIEIRNKVLDAWETLSRSVG